MDFDVSRIKLTDTNYDWLERYKHNCDLWHSRVRL